MKYVALTLALTLAVCMCIAVVEITTKDSQRYIIEEELRWLIENKGDVVMKWHVGDNDWEMSEKSNGKAIYGAEVERGDKIVFVYFDHSNSSFKEMLVSYAKANQRANVAE